MIRFSGGCFWDWSSRKVFGGLFGGGFDGETECRNYANFVTIFGSLAQRQNGLRVQVGYILKPGVCGIRVAGIFLNYIF